MNYLLRFAIIIPALLTAIVTTSCDDDIQESTTAPRTVLVYMIADNSLGSYGYDSADIVEMEAAASKGALGKSRLLVYHDPAGASPRLLEISEKGSCVLREYPDSPLSVTSERMNEVFSDMIVIAPAERYGLILWSHANGWLQDGMEAPQGASVLSFGSDHGNTMNITTLAETVESKGFDYIYFDCCHMASVEVAYQLRHATSLIAGSVAELPAEGMPYDITLSYLMMPEADLASACKATFNYYDTKPDNIGGDRTCTISLISTEPLDALAETTAAIMRSTTGLPDGFRPQQFMRNNCYLFDFGQYIEALAESVPDELADEWQRQMNRTIVYKAATPRIFNIITINCHSGLSTNILTSTNDADRGNYRQLNWYTNVISSLYFKL